MTKHDGSKGAPDESVAPDPERENGGRDADTAAAGGGDEETRPRTLEQALDRIDLLREQLAAKTAEVLDGQEKVLRERAELENFKRRMQRDKTEALRYACEPLLRDLLPVIDNLERAVGAARDGKGTPATEDRIAGLVTGVEMVLHQFLEVLGRSGVSRIAAVDRPFDPNEHEAVATVETLDKPSGTVLEEHAPGYRLHDRLLRPAQVTVAKAPQQIH